MSPITEDEEITNSVNESIINNSDKETNNLDVTTDTLEETSSLQEEDSIKKNNSNTNNIDSLENNSDEKKEMKMVEVVEDDDDVKNKKGKKRKKNKKQRLQNKQKSKKIINKQKKERQKSLRGAMSFTFILFLTILWAGSIVGLFFVLNWRLNIFIENRVKKELGDIKKMVQFNVEDEPLEKYIDNYQYNTTGFSGIVLDSGEELIVGGENSDKTKIIKRIINENNKPDDDPLKSNVIGYNSFNIIWETFGNRKIGFIAYNPYASAINIRLFLLASGIVFIVIGIIISAFLINIFLKGFIVKPIIQFVKKAEIVKDGDLTINFEAKKNDEIGMLSNVFNGTVSTLKSLIQKIYVVIIIMSKNLRILFKSTKLVTDSANKQAVTVEQTVGNFENMNRMIEVIVKETSKANDYTTQALSKARIGMDSMSKLEDEMGKIEASSNEITNIIELINEIAEQTNMLSLNASIESARAGEAGKGFSIVAGEVRKLAEKSTQAANRIQELIINNNAIINEGVNYSKDTTTILKEIALSNELIAGLVKNTTEEIQKVKLSSGETLTAINQISEIAQLNLSENEQVSDAIDDFVKQTIELQKFVGQFDVRSEHIKDNQKHIEEILKAKLVEVDSILNQYGTSFLPTGNTVNIGGYEIQELQLGSLIVTGNVDLVDAISAKTNTSATLFQVTGDVLVRVATTVRNFDDTRAIGTTITSNSIVFKTVMSRNVYYGRAFVVNRWYVAVYRPIIDETGYILGVLYLGLPEDMEILSESTPAILQDDGIVKEKTFYHNF